jgi:hypothetical protein
MRDEDKRILLTEASQFLKNWEDIEDPLDMFTQINQLILSKPQETLAALKPIVTEQLFTRNKKNVSLLYAILTFPSFYLHGLVNDADPQALVEHIAPYKFNRYVIVNIIFKILIPAEKYDLAYHVAHKHFELKIYQCLIQALIAKHEKNIKKEQLFYVLAIMHGSIDAYYRLQVTIEDGALRLDVLNAGARKGCIKSTITLMFIFEKKNMLLPSFQYAEIIQQRFDENPNPKLPVDKSIYDAVERRLQFYASVKLFIMDIFQHRIKLVKSRCSIEHLPALQAASEKRFQRELADRLYETTWKTLLNQIGPKLLEKYLAHQDVFKEISTIIVDAMHVDSEPNKGLLSMQPNEFAKTLSNTLSQYYLARQPLRNKLDESCGTRRFNKH